MDYRPEIDGLRAVAVLPVVLFHAGFAGFPGGFVGVDVFFVISGYLITSILIEELQAGRFSIARFYERRARRILPALFFVLLATTAAGWVWMVPSEFEEYSRALVAVVMFVSNIYFWRSQNYFAPVAELNPLLHTWSLAVEEHFYIVFPIFLLAIWRFGSGRVLWMLVALSAASLLLSEWGWRNKPAPTFFLLPTRAWELGVGSICAVGLRYAALRPSALLAGLGLGLIAASVFLFDAETPFPSIYALAPVGGAALVILYGSAGTHVARLLSVRLIVGVGLISYSAYLWHQPMFALARVRSLAHPSPVLMLGLTLASFALAYASWRWVEQPFRRRPLPLLPQRRAVLAASVAAGAALLAVGLYGQLSQGRVQAWMTAHPDRALVYALYQAANRIQGVYLDDGACQFNLERLDTAAIERLRDCRQRLGPGVAILGDSHGTDFFNGMDALHHGGFLFGMTFAGCWLDSAPRDCDFAAFAALLSDQPGMFRQVIYHQAGFRFFRTPEWPTGGREPFEWIPEYARLPVERFSMPEEPIKQGLDYLARLSKHANLVWVGPRIEPHIGLNVVLNGGCHRRYALRDGQEALFKDLDARLAIAAAAAGVAYVSLIDAIHFDMATDFINWRDGDHWSAEAAAMFVGRLLARDPPELRVEARNGSDLLR